jgi:hypothetical protein
MRRTARKHTYARTCAHLSSRASAYAPSAYKQLAHAQSMRRYVRRYMRRYCRCICIFEWGYEYELTNMHLTRNRNKNRNRNRNTNRNRNRNRNRNMMMNIPIHISVYVVFVLAFIFSSACAGTCSETFTSACLHVCMSAFLHVSIHVCGTRHSALGTRLNGAIRPTKRPRPISQGPTPNWDHASRMRTCALGCVVCVVCVICFISAERGCTIYAPWIGVCLPVEVRRHDHVFVRYLAAHRHAQNLLTHMLPRGCAEQHASTHTRAHARI